MVKKAVKINTIAHFKGDYIDDNNEKAKERRHLLLEKEKDDLFFIKFTSQKRKWLNQVRLIKIEPELVKCLNKISYPVFNRKVKISLSDLEATNYQYFYVCSLHSGGCLRNEKFAEIYQKSKEFWEDKLTPELEKKTLFLKANELKPTNETPWWVNYTSKDRKEKNPK